MTASASVLRKLARSLPQSPQEKRFVLAKMAKEVALTVRGQPSCQSQKDLHDGQSNLPQIITAKMKFFFVCFFF